MRLSRTWLAVYPLSSTNGYLDFEKAVIDTWLNGVLRRLPYSGFEQHLPGGSMSKSPIDMSKLESPFESGCDRVAVVQLYVEELILTIYPTEELRRQILARDFAVLVDIAESLSAEFPRALVYGALEVIELKHIDASSVRVRGRRGSKSEPNVGPDSQSVASGHPASIGGGAMVGHTPVTSAGDGSSSAFYSSDWMLRRLKMGAAVVAGGAALGIAGLVALPALAYGVAAIGAGLGGSVGLSMAAAGSMIGTSLGGVGTALTLTSVGAGLTLYKAKSRMGDLEDFSVLRVPYIPHEDASDEKSAGQGEGKHRSEGKHRRSPNSGDMSKPDYLPKSLTDTAVAQTDESRPGDSTSLSSSSPRGSVSGSVLSKSICPLHEPVCVAGYLSHTHANIEKKVSDKDAGSSPDKDAGSSPAPNEPASIEMTAMSKGLPKEGHRRRNSHKTDSSPNSREPNSDHRLESDQKGKAYHKLQSEHNESRPEPTDLSASKGKKSTKLKSLDKHAPCKYFVFLTEPTDETDELAQRRIEEKPRRKTSQRKDRTGGESRAGDEARAGDQARPSDHLKSIDNGRSDAHGATTVATRGRASPDSHQQPHQKQNLQASAPSLIPPGSWKQCVCGFIEPFTGFEGALSVVWEIRNLERSSALVSRMIREDVGTYVAQWTLHALTAASLAGLPLTVVKTITDLDNAWLVVRDRADQAGEQLFEYLISRIAPSKKTSDKNPAHQSEPAAQTGAPPAVRFPQMVSIVTYGIGAKAVVRALKLLKEACVFNAVFDVVFVGAAMSLTGDDWNDILTVSSGKVVNCYSKQDWLLSVLCRYVEWQFSVVAGSSAVSMSGVSDVDITAVADKLSEYPSKLNQIVGHLVHTKVLR